MTDFFKADTFELGKWSGEFLVDSHPSEDESRAVSTRLSMGFFITDVSKQTRPFSPHISRSTVPILRLCILSELKSCVVGTRRHIHRRWSAIVVEFGYNGDDDRCCRTLEIVSTQLTYWTGKHDVLLGVRRVHDGLRAALKVSFSHDYKESHKMCIQSENRISPPSSRVFNCSILLFLSFFFLLLQVYWPETGLYISTPQ